MWLFGFQHPLQNLHAGVSFGTSRVSCGNFRVRVLRKGLQRSCETFPLPLKNGLNTGFKLFSFSVYPRHGVKWTEFWSFNLFHFSYPLRSVRTVSVCYIIKKASKFWRSLPHLGTLCVLLVAVFSLPTFTSRPVSAARPLLLPAICVIIKSTINWKLLF